MKLSAWYYRCDMCNKRMTQPIVTEGVRPKDMRLTLRREGWRVIRRGLRTLHVCSTCEVPDDAKVLEGGRYA